MRAVILGDCMLKHEICTFQTLAQGMLVPSIDVCWCEHYRAHSSSACRGCRKGCARFACRFSCGIPKYCRLAFSSRVWRAFCTVNVLFLSLLGHSRAGNFITTDVANWLLLSTSRIFATSRFLESSPWFIRTWCSYTVLRTRHSEINNCEPDRVPFAKSRQTNFTVLKRSSLLTVSTRGFAASLVTLTACIRFGSVPFHYFWSI